MLDESLCVNKTNQVKIQTDIKNIKRCLTLLNLISVELSDKLVQRFFIFNNKIYTIKL